MSWVGRYLEWSRIQRAIWSVYGARVAMFVTLGYSVWRAWFDGFALSVLWAGLALLFFAKIVCSMKWPRPCFWASFISYGVLAWITIRLAVLRDGGPNVAGVLFIAASVTSMAAALLYHRVPKDEVRL